MFLVFKIIYLIYVIIVLHFHIAYIYIYIKSDIIQCLTFSGSGCCSVAVTCRPGYAIINV